MCSFVAIWCSQSNDSTENTKYLSLNFILFLIKVSLPNFIYVWPLVRLFISSSDEEKIEMAIHSYAGRKKVKILWEKIKGVSLVKKKNHTRSCRPCRVNEEAEESRQKYANSLKSSGHKRQKSQEDDKNLTKEVGVSESWIHTFSLLDWMTLRPFVSVKKLSWEEVGKEGRDCLEEKPAVTWPAPLEC